MRGKMTRFHSKLIDSMIFTIFNDVHTKCGHNMKDTQATLSQLFFGEPYYDIFDKVSHPEVLKDVCVKHLVTPGKFLEVFEHVQNYRR